MSRENIERSTFFFASALPLSCLILDQRLWPDCTIVDVENCTHRGHMESPRETRERTPLENAAMTESSGVTGVERRLVDRVRLKIRTQLEPGVLLITGRSHLVAGKFYKIRQEIRPQNPQLSGPQIRKSARP